MAVLAVFQAGAAVGAVVAPVRTQLSSSSSSSSSPLVVHTSHKHFKIGCVAVKFFSAPLSLALASAISSPSSSPAGACSSSTGVKARCSQRASSAAARDRSWVVRGGNPETSQKQQHLRISAISEIAEAPAPGSVIQLDNDDASSSPRASTKSSSASSAATAQAEATPTGQSRTFQSVTTEEELFDAISYEAKAKALPKRASAGMQELYCNYRDAVLRGGVENARDTAVRVISAVLDRILLQFEEPFTFPSYHVRMREPYDYYAFGQEYIRPLIDFRNSYLGNVEIFDEMDRYLKQGDNVFVFANHQTEADPAVMALLLEARHPYLAENLTYIAGDRVVLDPFCKPFSMGRNLLCVYSKKHINDVPELSNMKQRANTRAMKEMTALLKKGGQLIWIAPSGGRDRPDPMTGDWIPAAFDAAAVENMRRLLGHMPVPGHMYPMSLLCHDIMPPPRQVEKELGEKRLIGYTGVGLAAGTELRFDAICEPTVTKEEGKEQFAAAVFDIVKDQYSVLNRAIFNEGRAAATGCVHLSQPWLDAQNNRQ